MVWSKWEVGGEYTKSIIVKNVSQKVRAAAVFCSLASELLVHGATTNTHPQRTFGRW